MRRSLALSDDMSGASLIVLYAARRAWTSTSGVVVVGGVVVGGNEVTGGGFEGAGVVSGAGVCVAHAVIASAPEARRSAVLMVMGLHR